MAWPNWVRRYGAHYAGQWVAVNAEDCTVDHDDDRATLLQRLAESGAVFSYVARVPNRRRVT